MDGTQERIWPRCRCGALRARRRRLAARLGRMWRRCWRGRWSSRGAGAGSAGCRCAAGELHGPYTYFAARPAGPRPVEYVPAELAEAVRRVAAARRRVEAVLAEITAINAELLARRELE